MSKPLRPKRGTKGQNDAFTGLASEVTIDTDSHSIRVHDGVTAGGHEIPTKAMSDARYVTSGGGSMTGNLNMGTNSVVLNGKGLYGTSQGLVYGGDKVALGKDYLPLSGGTMSGAIVNNTTLARMSVSDGEIDICAYPEGSFGARFALNGENRVGYEGRFILQAQKEGKMYAFEGLPDGVLRWGGHDVERVYSSGDNWIRYESGVQICWGFASPSNRVYSVPVPYVGDWLVIGMNAVPDAGWTTKAYAQGKALSSTTFFIRTRFDGTSYDDPVSWASFGKWK